MKVNFDALEVKPGTDAGISSSTRYEYSIRPLLILTCFIFVALAKLVLIAQHDIVAADRPHDDYWHILAADKWVWGRPYDAWTLIHLPIYALFIAMSGATGLPLRLSTELIYIVSCAILSLSLGRIGLTRLLQLIVFMLLVFHSYTFNSFDFSLAEIFYSSLIILLVGLLIRVLAPNSRAELNLSTALFAAVTAAIWYTRKESILIGGLIALIALGVALAYLRQPGERKAILGLMGRLVALPVAAVIALGATITVANGLRYGLWHTNELSATNFMRAYASLQAIRPDQPKRFVSITKDVRERAYMVSPAFRELRAQLDGESEHWTKSATRELLDAKDEIGTGWFYWALIDAAATNGYFKSAQDAQAFFGRIAAEISAALQDGRLPKRDVILPYVDPELSLWLPHVPASLLAVAKQFLINRTPDYPASVLAVDSVVTSTFDRVANRRAYAVAGQRYTAEGWVAGVRPTGVHITDLSGRTVRSDFRPVSRPDVRTSDDANPHGLSALGYVIHWSAHADMARVKFRIVLESGKFAESGPINTLPIGRAIQLQTIAPEPPIVLAVDRIESPLVSCRELIEKMLVDWYPIALAVFMALSFLHWGGALARRRPLGSIPAAILLFLLAVIISRVVFFAVLDASSWSGEQTRYLLPALLLVPAIPGVVFALGRLQQTHWPDTGRLSATGTRHHHRWARLGHHDFKRWLTRRGRGASRSHLPEPTDVCRMRTK